MMSAWFTKTYGTYTFKVSIESADLNQMENKFKTDFPSFSF